jgi:rubrerythrin
LTVIQGTEIPAPQEPPPEPTQPGPSAQSPKPKAELRCLDCGYGAVASTNDIRCPMCGGESWDFAEWRPFTA